MWKWFLCNRLFSYLRSHVRYKTTLPILEIFNVAAAFDMNTDVGKLLKYQLENKIKSLLRDGAPCNCM